MVRDAVLLEVVRAFQRSDGARAASFLSPQVVWHSPGRRQPAAGTHHGLEEVLGAFATIATAPGTLTLEIVAALSGNSLSCNGDYETVVYRHRRDGKSPTLDADIALVARVLDGRVVEVWEHIYDLYSFDAFYASESADESTAGI